MAALMELCYDDWANLPDPVLIQVFSYLSVTDICSAGATCKHWLQCSKAPELWRFVSFSFCRPAHRKRVKVFEQYGHFLHGMSIVLNQREAENRKNVISVLEHMSSLENIRLSCLSIIFMEKNPPVYDGREFLTALEKLLTKIGEKKEKSKLKILNLRGLQAHFSDDFIGKISANCPNLEYLNILNKMLPCSVSPHSIYNLVLKCYQLQELHLFYASLCDHVLEALARPDRPPLKRLKINCKGHEKYDDDPSSKAWSSLHRASPDLKVQLEFHGTCPHHSIIKIMKPEIPVQELVFINFTHLHCEINIAVAYYGHMLEKLVIETWPFLKLTEWPPIELQKSLLNVARGCKKLRALYVINLLEKDVIDEILELSHLLRETRDYSLQCPWFQNN